MLAVIWVILLFADKAPHGAASNVSLSLSERQGTEATSSGSFSGNKTTLETTTDSKKIDIIGSVALKKGGTLNLTCNAEGFPESSIILIKSDSKKSLNTETVNGTQTKWLVSLITPNVTAEHYEQYICTARHQNNTGTKPTNVAPSGGGPRILNTSKCERQSEVLTCVCISEGFPSPTIEWSYLDSQTEYSVTTTVSNAKVTSNITVPLKHFHNTTIECVSRNNIKAATFSITPASQENDPFKALLTIAQEPKVIFAALTGFVIGIILSTIVLCLVTKSCRKKQKTSENLSENLEMVTTEAVPMMDADETAVYDGIHEPEADEGEAQPAGQSAPDDDLAPKEVEYSNINFSAIKTRNPEGAVTTQDTTETEYAEIKKEGKRQENNQEDSEMLEGNEEQEVMTEEDNDAIKEGDEDVPLYSSVDEIMA